ncbi:MAG: hypothetical protein CSA50_07375 [Gammaproteobacteria bacterium]|nr:MAG: hypothetical protein CSA50_07375 [Gammaproteobacteria bacterium]
MYNQQKHDMVLINMPRLKLRNIIPDTFIPDKSTLIVLTIFAISLAALLTSRLIEQTTNQQPPQTTITAPKQNGSAEPETGPLDHSPPSAPIPDSKQPEPYPSIRLIQEGSIKTNAALAFIIAVVETESACRTRVKARRVLLTRYEFSVS